MTHPIADAPHLEVIDILSLPDRDLRLAALQDLAPIHIKDFPDHAHVIGELEELVDAPYPGVIVHAWLLQDRGRPVGEVIFHVCLRRRVVLWHFLSMDPQAHADLPRDWLAQMTDYLQEVAQADAAAHGVELYGITAEVYRTATDYWRWSRKGFLVLAVDYREPHHGMHWAKFGEPEFFDMTLILRLLDAGQQADPGDVLESVLSAFLIDHYRLPRDNPTVKQVFDEAAELGYAQVDLPPHPGHQER